MESVKPDALGRPPCGWVRAAPGTCAPGTRLPAWVQVVLGGRPRACVCACAVGALTWISPGMALGTNRHPIVTSSATNTGPTGVGRAKTAPTFPVPASARVHGTTPATTPAPTANTPATGATNPAPANRTPSGGTPANLKSTNGTPVGTPAGTTPTATPQGGIPTPRAGTPRAGTSGAGPLGAGTPGAGTPGVGTPATGTTSRVGTARARRSPSSKLSTGALVGAALAGLLILLCAIWGIVRWMAIEPRWTRSLSYALEEAGSRAAATWAELLDWVRLGH